MPLSRLFNVIRSFNPGHSCGHQRSLHILEISPDEMSCLRTYCLQFLRSAYKTFTIRDFNPNQHLDCMYVCMYTYMWASLVAQLVKNLPAMQETLVRFLGREDPLEKG